MVLWRWIVLFSEKWPDGCARVLDRRRNGCAERDIWTVEGGTEYEYEEYKNAFGNEPPLPEELDHLRPDDPDPNPNPGDGDDDKDDPDNPGTDDPDPDDPDNPGTDDPDPDDPDNPGTDDPDPDDPDTPGIDDPDPDEPDQPVPAAGEWLQHIEYGRYDVYTFR